MLSICIPVYDYNVTSLIEELSAQAQAIPSPIEIVIIDDGSKDEYRIANEEICSKEIYIKLEKNIGRAKIRNLFLQHSQYDYLLYLDCDSVIATSDFISNYMNLISTKKPMIACGGRIYDPKIPGRRKKLRWKYGIERESQPLEVRQKNPNKSFMTNNFLINKKVLDENRFDERITQYGHEDTLFGYQLRKKEITIMHIDNPVLNGDIEDNAEYLEKTATGIKNLIHILEYINFDEGFIQDVSILKFYEQLKRKKRIFLTYFLFKCTRLCIKLLLNKGYVSLRLFNFYKLGILIQNMKYLNIMSQ